MRKVGSKNRLRKVGPKRWAEGQQVMGFDATEAKFRLSEKWSDAERNKKQEEMKICKCRSRGLRCHAAGLRGWTVPQQHSSLQCSIPLVGQHTYSTATTSWYSWETDFFLPLIAREYP